MALARNKMRYFYAKRGHSTCSIPLATLCSSLKTPEIKPVIYAGADLSKP
jgi:hypothetical protein